jgi:hypothetical protein
VTKQIAYRLIVIMACVTTGTCYGQRADTTIHKRHYSACTYYPGAYDRIQFENNEPKILFSLGNYEDTLKTGHWLYFFPTGLLLAEGNYEKGVKTGKWKYYLGNGNCNIVTFYAKYPSGERICFGPGNSPQIHDTRAAKTYTVNLINGSQSSCWPTVILD